MSTFGFGRGQMSGRVIGLGDEGGWFFWVITIFKVFALNYVLSVSKTLTFSLCGAKRDQRLKVSHLAGKNLLEKTVQVSKMEALQLILLKTDVTWFQLRNAFKNEISWLYTFSKGWLSSLEKCKKIENFSKSSSNNQQLLMMTQMCSNDSHCELTWGKVIFSDGFLLLIAQNLYKNSHLAQNKQLMQQTGGRTLDQPKSIDFSEFSLNNQLCLKIDSKKSKSHLLTLSRTFLARWSKMTIFKQIGLIANRMGQTTRKNQYGQAKGKLMVSRCKQRAGSKISNNYGHFPFEAPFQQLRIGEGEGLLAHPILQLLGVRALHGVFGTSLFDCFGCEPVHDEGVGFLGQLLARSKVGLG